MNTFLSSVAVLLSTLALIFSGYTAYQVFILQQTLNTANITAPATSTPANITSAAPETSPSPNSTVQSTNASGAAISPGQFLQPAFSNRAEVELLSVKRIKDPQTANRDVVNVQMRVRRLATDGVNPGESLGIFNTTARNPETSETYKGVDFERSTGNVSLFSLRPKVSADAYVWLRVPEGINTLDIFVPDTAAFKNVPISN